MKTDKQLMKLIRIIEKAKEAEYAGNIYSDYLKANFMSLDSKTNLNKLRDFESKLSNVLGAILDSKDIFDNSEQDWNIIMMEAQQKYSVKHEGCTKNEELQKILRIARNWEEHPDKVNQIAYRYAADRVDPYVLFNLLGGIGVLLNKETKNLSDDELQRMVANSEALHSRIYFIQSSMGKIKDIILNNAEISSEIKKTFSDFLDFEPNQGNVILDDDEFNGVSEEK